MSFLPSDATPLVSASPPSPRRRLVTALAASALLAGAVLGFSSSSPSPASSASVLSTSAPRACTFDECYSSACDWTLAPFTCLLMNGGPHGGCSATPWIEGTCDEQCNLSGCAGLPIPDDTPDCVLPCPSTWCEDEARLCGADVPYQCVKGAAAYGCSDDKLHWTLEVAETACGECCDVGTC
ncbi:hypothetical protein TrLO_g15712 [Triparma laevis f. longispina]|uniref:Uncharacterized protein n=1 Tax=Triparma laevis f. longispina TaxID=1714387 RepID=A0A9W7KV37_9STRA|nr:hypothetical protein TrLO_g15712 [Triparma laevis f. longispina]